MLSRLLLLARFIFQSTEVPALQTRYNFHGSIKIVYLYTGLYPSIKYKHMQRNIGEAKHGSIIGERRANICYVYEVF